jgi:hypothetical protein
MQRKSRFVRLLACAGVSLWVGLSAVAANAAPPLPRAHDYEDWLKYRRPYEQYNHRRTPGPDWFGGSCNREQVAGAIGGAIGGFVGSRIGEDDVRVGATAAGALLGYFIGAQIGRSMDENDIACGVRKFELTEQDLGSQRLSPGPTYW